MTVALALTQKWFDQNHTRRSTRPVSALIAASKWTLASLRNSCRGSGTVSGFSGGGDDASGFASIAASASALCAAASRRSRSRFPFAARSALYSKTARLAAPLLGRSGAAISPAFGRSSSARSAPRGSNAMASIEPARGPKPNRCNASTAFFGSQAISVVVPEADEQAVICSRSLIHHRYLPPLCPGQSFGQHMIGLLVGAVVAQRRDDDAARLQCVDIALGSLLARPPAE